MLGQGLLLPHAKLSLHCELWFSSIGLGHTTKLSKKKEKKRAYLL